MPSSATITAFYNFTSNTKARASQVQNNFDVFRGHILPVHPSTATSADITYDLGSNEYRWRTGYFKTIDFDRNTTTSTITLSHDDSATGGALVTTIGGNERHRIKGVFDITTSANKFGFAAVTLSATTYTTTASFIAGSTITLISTGNPVCIGVAGSPGDIIAVANTTGVVSLPQIRSLNTDIRLHTDTTTSFISFNYATAYGAVFTTTAVNTSLGGSSLIARWAGHISTIIFPAAGTHTYYMRIIPTGADQGGFSGGAPLFYAYELK